MNRVLVQRLAAETKTKGGIMLPEKSLGKVLQGTVVSVGPGSRLDSGTVVPPAVAVGDKVLLPEYGGTKVNLNDEVCMFFPIVHLTIISQVVSYNEKYSSH